MRGSTADMLTDSRPELSEVIACAEYAAWRAEYGPLLCFLQWLLGAALEKPAGYEEWKRYAWPGIWP